MSEIKALQSIVSQIVDDVIKLKNENANLRTEITS